MATSKLVLMALGVPKSSICWLDKTIFKKKKKNLNMHQPNDAVAARSITDSFATRPCTIGQIQVINEMESWDLSWKILQLNFDIKHPGKYFNNAHPERKSPHQPHWVISQGTEPHHSLWLQLSWLVTRQQVLFLRGKNQSSK